MDTTDICRVCMEDDGYSFSSLFDSTLGYTVTPSVMISDCAGISVYKGDGLPEMACSECLNAIKDAYKIREKCRKTDRKLRKILNLVHKSQTTLNNVGDTGEKAEFEVLPSNSILQQKPSYEETDVLEESAQNIKSELQIEQTNRTDLSTFDQADRSGNYHAVQNPDPKSSQVTVDYCHKDSELQASPVIIVKQEVQQKLPNSEQEYLIEEITETIEPNANKDHSKISADEQYQNELTQRKNHSPLNSNLSSNIDEDQSVNMQVEVLEDDECDEYEDYEAIDEDFETEDFIVQTSSIESTVCCGCSMEFSTKADLEDHSKSIHMPEKDKDTVLQDWYMCEICYKRHSSLKALNYHKLNRVNKRMRTCNSCQLVLNSVRKKRHHEQLHKLLPEDYKINCCGCDQLVLFKQLGSHAEKTHKNKNLSSVSKFVCEVCFLDCGFKQRLHNHQSKQDLPQVVKKQTQPDDKFVATVVDIDGKQRFICDICEKNFSTKGNLKSHLFLHGASDKPYKCANCDKNFSKKSNYNVHMLRAHSTESQFSCLECNKVFKCATNLKTHMRVHTKEKPYRCDFCHKAFGYLSDKRRHEIGHSGNYPYKCGLCGKPYTRKTLLNRHFKGCRRRVSKTTVSEIKAEVLYQTREGEIDSKTKPTYTCDLCDDWFATMEELADHHAQIHIQTLDEGTFDAEVEIE